MDDGREETGIPGETAPEKRVDVLDEWQEIGIEEKTAGICIGSLAMGAIRMGGIMMMGLRFSWRMRRRRRWLMG